MSNAKTLAEGVFPIYKAPGRTSFSLVQALRKKTGIRKIGHAGTLDPFAEGVMILLIGRTFTRQANTFLNQDKKYEALLQLGSTTTTYDIEGDITTQNSYIPSQHEILEALRNFQGTVEQIPPMFSAKKIDGKKLYTLARKGIQIKRKPITVTLDTTLMYYQYPHLQLHIHCSKGTYIRSLAHDLGEKLGCGAFLKKLVRTQCGPYGIQDCLTQCWYT